MQSVDRIVKILELLSKYKDGVGIKEISESIDLPLSTTHRIISSLKGHGYIEQDNVTKKYKIGVQILSLAIKSLNNMNIIDIVRPIIESLSTQYGQLVFLSIQQNYKTICVDMVNNSEQIRFYVQLGSHMPAHCASSSKAIVAFLDNKDIDYILNTEERKVYTRYTKTETDDIKEEFAQIRKLGYAICDEEMEIGVKSISVPIFGYNRGVRASITIMLLKQFQYDEKQIIKDLKKAAKKISSLLGATEL